LQIHSVFSPLFCIYCRTCPNTTTCTPKIHLCLNFSRRIFVISLGRYFGLKFITYSLEFRDLELNRMWSIIVRLSLAKREKSFSLRSDSAVLCAVERAEPHAVVARAERASCCSVGLPNTTPWRRECLLFKNRAFKEPW
jgi:hypothetical protein